MSNNLLNPIAGAESEALSMTLKEITDLLDVRHNNAMRIVERMAEESSFGTLLKISSVYNERGQATETYLLDKRQSLAVAARLNVAMQMRVIDRWMELESEHRKPKTRLELALEQVRLIEELETKQAEVNALRIELDDSHEWATIKRVEALTGGDYSWMPLKDQSLRTDLGPRPVFDANYGKVNSYHRDVWLSVYGIDLGSLAPQRSLKQHHHEYGLVKA